MGKFTKHNALTDDGDMYGPITITSSLVVSGAVTCDSISFSGSQTFEGGMVINDLQAAVDFRVEGDTLPNLLLLDGSADRIFVTDAATAGTPPTGTYTAGTLLVVANNSAVTDDSILAISSGATSGVSEIHFGDSADVDEGIISYDNATDLFTVTATTVPVLTIGPTAIITDEAGAGTVDVRMESANNDHMFFMDATADRIFITDAGAAPTETFAGDVLLAIVNNSAGGDNAILALTSDATSGVSEVHFGDTDTDAGILSYDNATDLFTITAGTAAVLTVGAAIVTDEAGAGTVDVRMESANNQNMFLMDATADRVYLTDAATGGTPPTETFTAGTLLALVNTSTVDDDAILAITSGATTGLSEIHFGDSDTDAGKLSYDNATDTFTLTAGTADVFTASATALTATGTFGITGATTVTGNCTVTDTVDTDTLVLGTAAMALGDADNDDVADPGCSVAIISGPTAAFTISGIAGGADGRVLFIINNVAQNLTFENENGGSAAANRITTSTGANVVTTAAGYAILVYNGTTSRWNLIASST
jgi:copper(I)-binding protein